MTDLIDAVDRHTTLLVRDVASVGDLSTPSLCVGWRLDHVVNHVSRNAEGLSRLVRAAVDGSGETMYSSDEARDAEIDEGVGRPIATVVDELASTAAELSPLLRRLAPEHAGIVVERTPGGRTFRAGALAFLRLREVVYHHVDLGLGFTFADVEPEVQQLFIDNEVKRQAGTDQPPGVTLTADDGASWTLGSGETVVTGSRGAILGWLARQDTSGVTTDGDLPQLEGGL